MARYEDVKPGDTAVWATWDVTPEYPGREVIVVELCDDRGSVVVRRADGQPWEPAYGMNMQDLARPMGVVGVRDLTITSGMPAPVPPLAVEVLGAASRKGVDAVADELVKAAPGGDGISYSTAYDGLAVSTIFEIDRRGETLHRFRITVTTEEIDDADS